jgi:hypothetical protein
MPTHHESPFLSQRRTSLLQHIVQLVQKRHEPTTPHVMRYPALLDAG